MKKPPPVTPDADAGQAALAWALGAGQGDALLRKVEATVKRRRRRRLAATAGVAAAFLLLGAVWQFRPQPAAALPLPASASITAPARQVLPDGSIIDLKDGAQVTVAYEPSLRRVILTAGEAHFAVARNQQRPFVVEAGGVEFRAVGTAFSVQLGASAVELLVTEGRVAVERDPGTAPVPDAPAPTLVDAGSCLLVDLAPATPVPAVLTVSPEDMQNRTAWLVPRLEFNATPLAEAIPLFNRYTREKLVLDPSLGSLQMSGILRADNTAALLRLLQDEFRIRAEPRGDEILLRR